MRLQNCELKAPKRAKNQQNRVDETRDSFKIAGFVGHYAGNLENTGTILQSPHIIKLLGRYPFSQIKAFLRKTSARTKEALDDAIAQAIDIVTPFNARN
ncbi:hypothetical protein FEE96_22815 [Parasedimentitalea maritima]|uniref:Uncharacterized protein n=2 Tax=Parasedimentitalea maritima TaxID=2578117 RepID=A0ABY2UNB2_9RHOB|nr:hypothetical protein FEE96_22815 [Zongyanglinia marina]